MRALHRLARRTRPTLRGSLLALAVLARHAAFGASAPDADPSIRIRLSLDEQGRLLVRYQAPADVSSLTFVDRSPRLREALRGGMMKSFDACGSVTPTGLALVRTGSCLDGATFLVTPRLLDLPGTHEPAQPSSDRGVLVYTGAFAAVAPGRPLRWEFVPPKDGYVVDEGARSAAPVLRAGDAPATLPAADAAFDARAQSALHASHYVFLGAATPVVQAPGFVFIRDPALPAPTADTLVETAQRVADAYARASGTRPAGPTTVVLLVAPHQDGRAFQGDRSEGRVLRLSFTDPVLHPMLSDVEAWRQFVAHELAHEWNQGVWRSDPATPWLQEGDADWIALTTLARAGGVSAATLHDRLEEAVNRCVLARGDAPAAAGRSDWRSHDDPLACGLALNLLARAQHPSPEGPLAAWAAAHRRAPSMTVADFAAIADADAAPVAAPAPTAAAPRQKGRTPAAPARAPAPAPAPAVASMNTLLLDPAAPFSGTYLQALAARLALQAPAGEPRDATLKEGIARRLFSELSLADCEGLGFTVRSDDIAIDRNLACRHLAPGRHVITLAGESLLAHPMAAWRMAAQSCALHAEVIVGFSDWRDETIACPATLSPPPIWVRLPDDAPARLGLVD